MKKISVFLSALVALLFSVAETSAQITPPYYNPANVAITGGNINGTTIGATTAAAGSFTTLASGNTAVTGTLSVTDNISTAKSARFTASSLGSAGDYYLSRYLTNLVYNAPTGAGHNWAINNGDAMSLSASLFSTASGVIVSILNTTDASSTTTGSLRTAGGLGVAKKAYFGNAVSFSSDSSAVQPFTLIDTNAAGATWFVGPGAGSGNRGDFNFYETVSAINALVISKGTGNVTINGGLNLLKTITAGGTTGAQTINKTSGRVNFAAGATSLVVTNSLAATTSIIHCTVATNDATMKSAACVAASGSFTIHAGVAPTAETAVNFTVTN
jgi:hypothetical protein